MDTADTFHGLVLSGVEDIPDAKSLGKGLFGRVYPVKYCGMTCAAKQIRSLLIQGVKDIDFRRILKSLTAECRQYSSLRHPNIVQFLGVYYRLEPNAGQGSMELPVMVMEMMADSLTSLMERHGKKCIPLHIKVSILNDVSLGLLYLHHHNIAHCDLFSNNVLLSEHHVAKISDLGVAKILQNSAISNKTSFSKAVAGNRDFMPPESSKTHPTYGPPTDVFSFAGIILHTLNQEWPGASDRIQVDPKNVKNKTVLSEIERRQQHFDKLSESSKAWKPLILSCLANDAKLRPAMMHITERIQQFSDTCKKLSQSLIRLHLENDELNSQLVRTLLFSNYIIFTYYFSL